MRRPYYLTEGPYLNVVVVVAIVILSVLEQQTVITQLYQRVSDLEGSSTALKQELRRTEAAVAAGAVALKALESHNERMVQDQIAKVDQRCAKRTSDLQAKMQTETAAVSRAVRDLSVALKK